VNNELTKKTREADIILEFLEPDQDIIDKGWERQKSIWEDEEPDYLPIVISGKVPERQNFPRYNLKEQFYNKDKMFIENLWQLIAQSRGNSDAQLSMRVNFGTGFIPSIFGLEQIVFEDKMPWLGRHLSKEEVTNFEFPEDIKDRGLMPMAIEYIEYFKEEMENKAHIFLPDTQGPFDIAHLLRGEEIFTDIYDDPDFVHRLMKLSTKAYIGVTEILKKAIGEEFDKGYHNALYMGKGGVRICEDSVTLLSPELIKEFVLPYTKEALKPFGGGWIHWCGNGNHILDLFLELEEVKGFNFGNPEMYDYNEVMRKVIEKKKFYFGGWPKNENENMKEYFKRILKPLNNRKAGLIFVPWVEDIEEPDGVIELWHSLQDYNSLQF